MARLTRVTNFSFGLGLSLGIPRGSPARLLRSPRDERSGLQTKFAHGFDAVEGGGAAEIRWGARARTERRLLRLVIGHRKWVRDESHLPATAAVQSRIALCQT